MTKPPVNILALMQRYICDNQIALTQYMFTANERHKAIKEFLTTENQSRSSHSIIDNEREILKHLIIQLDEHLFLRLAEIFEKSYEYIDVFFKDRSSQKARMTLKIIEAGKLVTLLKIPEIFLEHEGAGMSDNTAFADIATGDAHFICNDIPHAIKSNDYKNNRIDIEKAKKYKSPKSNNDSPDPEWANCWHPVIRLDGHRRIAAPPETCYKSTVVVPMSLPTKDLSQKFKNRFNLSSSNAERAIFGFLCLDHTSVGFFKDPVDIHFAYIISDMLSLYLIHQLMCTQYSSVYLEARGLASQARDKVTSDYTASHNS